MTNPTEPPPGWPNLDQHAAYRQPTQPAQLPAVPSQPTAPEWVIDQESGVPVRVLRPTAIEQTTPAPEAPAADPWPRRLYAGGIAASGTIATAGIFAPELAMLKGPAVAVAAACGGIWLLLNSGGKRDSTNVTVKIDNRRR